MAGSRNDWGSTQAYVTRAGKANDRDMPWKFRCVRRTAGKGIDSDGFAAARNHVHFSTIPQVFRFAFFSFLT
jgi:hypothetical protein